VEAIALGRLLPARGEFLLEVGAGAGRNTPRYRGFERVALLDYSRSQLEQARQRLGGHPGYLFVVGDAYSLPFAPHVFDAATMIRTLHHMADPGRALRQVRDVLRTGSSFVLEFPNKRNLKAILRWASGAQKWNPFSEEPVEFAQLHFDFHPRTVSTWLELAGFVSRRTLTVSHFRAGILKRMIPLGLLVGMDSLTQWTGDLWQLSPSVFVLAKASGSDADAPSGAFWRCPACGSTRIDEGLDAVRCQACGRLWVRRDGIWDFKTPMVERRSKGRPSQQVSASARDKRRLPRRR
jgi:SAM-dependent methyltransferase